MCPECEDTKRTSAALGAHRKLSHGVEPTHGTVGGYLKHRRDEEKACPECRKAWSAASKARKNS